MKAPNYDEHEEGDVYGNLAARNDSSTEQMTKQKASTHRSKHSETEQRRRIKINERFQTLMDLIPPNDQKRDKASFLLEVIEYIRFLKEKLQMYEGSHQIWNQGPTKLTPWRNNHSPAEEFVDHSQVIRSCSGHPPEAMLLDAPNSLESDINSVHVYKPLDHYFLASAASLIPSYMKPETNMSASTHPVVQSVQHDLWQVRPSTESAVNNINELENSEPECSASSSTVYSQGVINTLTEALQSAGVDLSQATVSVQLDAAKRADPFPSVVEFASKDNDNQIPDKETAFRIGVGRSYEESDRAQKRIKR